MLLGHDELLNFRNEEDEDDEEDEEDDEIDEENDEDVGLEYLQKPVDELEVSVLLYFIVILA